MFNSTTCYPPLHALTLEVFECVLADHGRLQCYLCHLKPTRQWQVAQVPQALAQLLVAHKFGIVKR